MTEKQAIWKSILHWRRMIKWVEGQDKRESPSFDRMLARLGETFGNADCSLCRFSARNHIFLCSSKCPLGMKFGDCYGLDEVENQPRNAFIGATYAITWAGWLQHARRLLKQLESLREKK